MNINYLYEEISIQLEFLDATVAEIETLQEDVGEGKPTLREIAAAAKFLADFYTGIENILKRISRYNGIELPKGEDWHAELFIRFCRPTFHGLPLIFENDMKESFARFRQFRHVTRQGYAMQLHWKLMSEGTKNVGPVYTAFKNKLHELYGV